VEDVNRKTESEDEANAPVGYGKYVDEKLQEAVAHYYADNSDANKYCLADVFYEGLRTGQHLSVLDADDKTIVAVKPKFNVGDTILKLKNSDINDFGQFTITDITGGKYYYNDRIICDIVDQDEWGKIDNITSKD
jgi:hypothetical protein